VSLTNLIKRESKVVMGNDGVRLNLNGKNLLQDGKNMGSRDAMPYQD
jgi:hypothetical protein